MARKLKMRRLSPFFIPLAGSIVRYKWIEEKESLGHLFVGKEAISVPCREKEKANCQTLTLFFRKIHPFLLLLKMK